MFIQSRRQPRWLSGLMRSRVHSLWLLVDHYVLRNWDRILVRAVKGLISRAGMVSICPLLWQRDVKLQQTYSHATASTSLCYITWTTMAISKILCNLVEKRFVVVNVSKESIPHGVCLFSAYQNCFSCTWGGRHSPAVACWASDHWVASSNPLRGKFRH